LGDTMPNFIQIGIISRLSAQSDTATFFFLGGGSLRKVTAEMRAPVFRARECLLGIAKPTTQYRSEKFPCFRLCNVAQKY